MILLCFRVHHFDYFCINIPFWHNGIHYVKTEIFWIENKNNNYGGNKVRQVPLHCYNYRNKRRYFRSWPTQFPIAVPMPWAWTCENNGSINGPQIIALFTICLYSRFSCQFSFCTRITCTVLEKNIFLRNRKFENDFKFLEKVWKLMWIILNEIYTRFPDPWHVTG